MILQTNSDGGARGNPGPGAIGVVVRNEDEILVKYSQMVGSFVTNNIAEYEGIIKALSLAKKSGATDLTCYLDSELVVKQLTGEYRVKNPKLLQLFLKVQKLQENFEKIKYVHVRRGDKFQEIADELLNLELEKAGYPKKIPKKKNLLFKWKKRDRKITT